MSAFSDFTGHLPRTVACDEHGAYDPDCMACVEADSYCPHGSLGLKHFWGAQEGDGCWRPWHKYDGEGPEL